MNFLWWIVSFSPFHRISWSVAFMNSNDFWFWFYFFTKYKFLLHLDIINIVSYSSLKPTSKLGFLFYSVSISDHMWLKVSQTWLSEVKSCQNFIFLCEMPIGTLHFTKLCVMTNCFLPLCDETRRGRESYKYFC